MPVANSSFKAKYFDGLQSQSYAAQVTMDKAGLIIQYNQTKVVWPYQALQIFGIPSSQRECILGCKSFPEARLIATDIDLHQLKPKMRKKNIHHAQVTHHWYDLLIIAIICIGLLTSAILLLPFGASIIAKTMPYEWDKTFGELVLNTQLQSAEECIAPSGMKALQILTERLTQHTELKHPVKVQVVKKNKNSVNAFATPGQHIVLYSGLIDFAEQPEEIAGVLAHEMAHAIEHHPTAGFIRQFGLLALMAGTTGTSIDFATFFINQKHSRNDENQADKLAVQILHNAQINHQGLIRFFQKLDKIEKIDIDTQQWLAYLSSHPALYDRIAQTKNLYKQYNPTPALTAKQWRALQNICSQTKPYQAPAD